MRATKREKGRKAALAKALARIEAAGRRPPIDQARFKTVSEENRSKYQTELEQHSSELRDLGLDPILIGEHEADPVMCSHCGEPIPWRVILTYRN